MALVTEVCLVAMRLSFPAPELLRLENGACMSVRRGELAGNLRGGCTGRSSRIKAVGVGAVTPHRDGCRVWGWQVHRDGGGVGCCPQMLWGVGRFGSGIGDQSTGFSLRHGESTCPVLEGLEEEEVPSDRPGPGRPWGRSCATEKDCLAFPRPSVGHQEPGRGLRCQEALQRLDS